MSAATSLGPRPRPRRPGPHGPAVVRRPGPGRQDLRPVREPAAAAVPRRGRVRRVHLAVAARRRAARRHRHARRQRHRAAHAAPPLPRLRARRRDRGRRTGTRRRCAPGPVVHGRCTRTRSACRCRSARCTRRRCSSPRSAGVAATALAAWGPARAAARTTPAEAMRVTPAGAGSRSLLERLVPPVRHLPARWRMVVRGLGRNRRRAAFTIVGVAVSLSLVLVFAGLAGHGRERPRPPVRHRRPFRAASCTRRPATTAGLVAAARRDPAVAAAEPFARVEVTLTNGAKRFDTILMGLTADTTMHHFVEPGGRTVTLPRNGGCCSAGVSAGCCRSVPVTSVTVTRRQRHASCRTRRRLCRRAAHRGGVHVARPSRPVVGRSTASGALVQLRSGVDA